jgi:hypothetical protein
MVHNLDGEALMTGMVHSAWATYAYRALLKRYLWEYAAAPVAAVSPRFANLLQPTSIERPPAVAPRPSARGRYDWTRADYSLDNPNWGGLALFARLCKRYLPDRCVLYTGPLNPHGRAALAEPGLYEAYLAQVRVIAGRYGIIWRDYSNTMNATDFRHPMFGTRGRDPIHLNEAGRGKLAELVVEPATEAVRNAVAAKFGTSPRPPVAR